MAMVVQHNITAMNASRMLGVTTGQQAKQSEKLASGYRINRAADDAAGLSISEKMRKQIRGLDQASTNAQDGVSAVQTAEGALTEVHSMLQRMNELAVQASNGTNSEADREAIQAEIEQLTTEIDRVAETTKFNETYLLKGETAGGTYEMKVAAHDAGLVGNLVDNGNGTATFTLKDELENGDKVTIAGKDYTIGSIKTDADYMVKDTAGEQVLKVGDSITHNGVTKTVVNKATETDADAYTWEADDTFTDKNGTKWTVIAKDDNNDLTTDADEAKTAGVGVVEADEVGDILGVGSIITANADKAITSENKIEVVKALTATEVSSLAEDDDRKVSAILGEDAAAGDVITKADGTKITVTEYVAESFVDIKADIMKLEADAATAVTVTINDDTYTVSTKTDLDNMKATREDIIAMIKEGDAVTIGTGDAETVYGVDQTVTDNMITVDDAYRMMAEELTKASSIGTDDAAVVVNKGKGVFEITQGTVEAKNSLSFNLHVGADADMTNKITVDIDSMSAANLGIKGINVADATGASATYAIDAIADAVSKVSAQRSALGAVQNRLDHTIANLDNVVENTTSAESRIRDTDMAEEMVEYSKNNILAQAGQSMLAQANQSTQGVLSLLQ